MPASASHPPRTNLSNTVGTSAGSMPGPVSVTSITALSAVERSPAVTSVPAGVWVRALASRFATDLVEPGLVAMHEYRLRRQVQFPGVVGPCGARIADGVDEKA